MKRIDILKKLAQTATSTSASTATSTTSTTVATPAAAAINIQSLPKFNANLFANKPSIVIDLNSIINSLNSYLSSGTAGKITFATVYNSPSETASTFPDAMRYLLTISKWVYSTVILQAGAYSLQSLQKIATDFINTVNSFPFSDPGAATIKTDLVNIGTTMSGKLGTPP